MAEVKGVLLDAWFVFLKQRYGEESVTRCIERLEPSVRVLMKGPFLAASWYPLETLDRLRDVVRLLSDNGGKQIGTDVGRFIAKYAYTGVYKSLLSNEPAKQAEKVAWIDEMFFSGVRKLETQLTSRTSCVAWYKYQNGYKPNPGMCVSLIGFWTQMLEMAGAATAGGAHPQCCSRGAKFCEFIFQWKVRTTE